MQPTLFVYARCHPAVVPGKCWCADAHLCQRTEDAMAALREHLGGRASDKSEHVYDICCDEARGSGKTPAHGFWVDLDWKAGSSVQLWELGAEMWDRARVHAASLATNEADRHRAWAVDVGVAGNGTLTNGMIARGAVPLDTPDTVSESEEADVSSWVRERIQQICIRRGCLPGGHLMDQEISISRKRTYVPWPCTQEGHAPPVLYDVRVPGRCPSVFDNGLSDRIAGFWGEVGLLRFQQNARAAVLSACDPQAIWYAAKSDESTSVVRPISHREEWVRLREERGTSVLEELLCGGVAEDSELEKRVADALSLERLGPVMYLVIETTLAFLRSIFRRCVACGPKMRLRVAAAIDRVAIIGPSEEIADGSVSKIFEAMRHRTPAARLLRFWDVEMGSLTTDGNTNEIFVPAEARDQSCVDVVRSGMLRSKHVTPPSRDIRVALAVAGLMVLDPVRWPKGCPFYESCLKRIRDTHREFQKEAHGDTDPHMILRIRVLSPIRFFFQRARVWDPGCRDGLIEILREVGMNTTGL